MAWRMLNLVLMLVKASEMSSKTLTLTLNAFEKWKMVQKMKIIQ